MAAEKDIQVVLVQEIEKHPALYNFKLAEYSKKDITEKAWSEISSKISLSGTYFLLIFYTQ